MARYGLLILTIVWNNLNYQTVRTNFHSFGGEIAKQKKYPEVYLGDPEIDFVMLARSQGIEGAEVREPQALESALRRGVEAITAGEPHLLDVRVATVGSGADSQERPEGQRQAWPSRGSRAIDRRGERVPQLVHAPLISPSIRAANRANGLFF
jgi:thiamine pyrophosphate-dependent acetolactate synthase large subunit-like protein